MIRVLFFATIRERLGTGQLLIDAVDNLVAAKALIAEQLGNASAVLDEENTVIAVNQLIVKNDIILNDGDELAFFPPVTGG